MEYLSHLFINFAIFLQKHSNYLRIYYYTMLGSISKFWWQSMSYEAELDELIEEEPKNHLNTDSKKLLQK